MFPEKVPYRRRLGPASLFSFRLTSERVLVGLSRRLPIKSLWPIMVPSVYGKALVPSVQFYGNRVSSLLVLNKLRRQARKTDESFK